MKQTISLAYRLADRIEVSETFTMVRPRWQGRGTKHPCGAPGCIAGHLADMVDAGEMGGPEYVVLISKQLNVSLDTANALYLGQFSEKDICQITAQEAAEAVRTIGRGERLPIKQRVDA